jgi:hypothetical protein
MSLWAGVKTVLSAFVGIRKGKSSDEDLQKLTPQQIIATAVVLFLGLIAAIATLVHFITRDL